MTNLAKKDIVNYFLSVLIVFIPLQSILLNVLQSHTQLSKEVVFWAVHWYEPFILLLFVAFLPKWIALPKKKAGIAFLIFLLAYGGLSSFFSSNLGRGLEGFRFALLPLLALFVASFSSNKLNLTKLYLTVSILIASWGVIESVLPPNYWRSWGVVASGYEFGFGNYGIVGANQITSILGGPNQLSSYLLPAFFLLLFAQKENLSGWLIKYRYLLVAAILLAIVLSLSRSTFVGLVIAFIIFLASILNKKKILILFLFLLLAIIAIYFFRKPLSSSDFITHGSSQKQHYESFKTSYNELYSRYRLKPEKLLLGSGLGTAGPLSIKYGEGIVSESWYLELALELGIIGLFSWLLVIFYLSRDILRTSKGLFFGLIAVLFTSLFLHTWADNPSLSYSLLILVGLQNGQNYYQKAMEKSNA